MVRLEKSQLNIFNRIRSLERELDSRYHEIERGLDGLRDEVQEGICQGRAVRAARCGPSCDELEDIHAQCDDKVDGLRGEDAEDVSRHDGCHGSS